MNIQWYPGHMTKAKRLVAENLKNTDAVCEIVDARIPISSRNPDIDKLVKNKPRLLILNRRDQAQPNATKLWSDYFKSLKYAVLETDSKSGQGVAGFSDALHELLFEKISKNKEKGMTGKKVKAMILGVPNVGKSSFINRTIKKRAAETSDRPGVTRGKQWFSLNSDIELLDTPGMLWPKFENEITGLNLAFTGAIRDDILDVETLAVRFIETLVIKAPGALKMRYGIEEKKDAKGVDLLTEAARKRGFLITGGEPDLERMARILLDEFRGGKLGRITLELPCDINGAEHDRI